MKRQKTKNNSFQLAPKIIATWQKAALNIGAVNLANKIPWSITLLTTELTLPRRKTITMIDLPFSERVGSLVFVNADFHTKVQIPMLVPTVSAWTTRELHPLEH